MEEEDEKEVSPTQRPSTQAISLSTKPLEEEEEENHVTTDIPTTITTTAKAQAYAPSSSELWLVAKISWSAASENF